MRSLQVYEKEKEKYGFYMAWSNKSSNSETLLVVELYSMR